MKWGEAVFDGCLPRFQRLIPPPDPLSCTRQPHWPPDFFAFLVGQRLFSRIDVPLRNLWDLQVGRSCRLRPACFSAPSPRPTGLKLRLWRCLDRQRPACFVLRLSKLLLELKKTVPLSPPRRPRQAAIQLPVSILGGWSPRPGFGPMNPGAFGDPPAGPNWFCGFISHDCHGATLRRRVHRSSLLSMCAETFGHPCQPKAELAPRSGRSILVFCVFATL